MKFNLITRKFNTGVFAFDTSDSVDVEAKLSLHVNWPSKDYCSWFFFSVDTGNGFGYSDRNPFKALMRAMEHETVAAIKYLRLKETLRENGMWRKL